MSIWIIKIPAKDVIELNPKRHTKESLQKMLKNIPYEYLLVEGSQISSEKLLKLINKGENKND